MKQGIRAAGALTGTDVSALKQFLSYVPDGAAVSLLIVDDELTFVADGGKDEGGPCESVKLREHVQ